MDAIPPVTADHRTPGRYKRGKAPKVRSGPPKPDGSGGCVLSQREAVRAGRSAAWSGRVGEVRLEDEGGESGVVVDG